MKSFILHLKVFKVHFPAVTICPGLDFDQDLIFEEKSDFYDFTEFEWVYGKSNEELKA